MAYLTSIDTLSTSTNTYEVEQKKKSFPNFDILDKNTHLDQKTSINNTFFSDYSYFSYYLASYMNKTYKNKKYFLLDQKFILKGVLKLK